MNVLKDRNKINYVFLFLSEKNSIRVFIIIIITVYVHILPFYSYLHRFLKSIVTNNKGITGTFRIVVTFPPLECT
jgi:hypothetical protein